MKKILTLCAGLLLVFGLSACNNSSGDLPGPGEEPEPEVTEPGPETGGDGDEGGEIGGEEEPDPSNPDEGLLNFESVSFVDAPYTLEVRATKATQLEVKPEGIDVSVTYTPKESLIATIDTDGVITGIGEGTTEVYATVSASGYNDAIAIAEVVVEAQHVETDYVKSITFLQSNGYTFKVGDTYDFKDTNGVYVDVLGSASQEFTLECDADGYTDYFTISGTSIAAVKATEDPITLKAIATGDTSKTAETTISITDKDEVTGVEFVDDTGATTSTFELGLTEGTLDLSSHVRVTGTGNYSQEFSLTLTSTDPSGCATLSNNVLTAVQEGTAVVTVTAGGYTASATITIVDDNVYVEEINFALESYQLWTGEIDSEHPEEMVVGVSVTYTDESTSTDAYSISIAEGGTSVVSYDETTKTLTALNVGTTQITATSTEQKKDGSSATATVDVTVQHNDILVNSISFSPNTWKVKENDSFTIGPSDSEADVTVTTAPDNADESSWELSTESNNITIGEPDGSGVYTITASALTNSGVAESASITVTPTSGKEGVSDTLGISIIAWDSDITYVNSITLNPTEKTIDEGEEFTIGTGEVDVAVTVDPAEATDPTYTVSCESDLIEVGNPNDGVVTIKANEGAGGKTEGGQTYDVVVTANDGSGKSSTLALTVNRPESVPTEITVTGGESLGLTSHNALDDSTADSIDLRSALTVKVIDQYDEEYTGTGGSDYTLSTSDTGLITLNEETGEVAAVAGASGTATVTVTSVATKADGDPLTTTVSITVTPKVYAVESISVTPDSTTVEWGETYTPEVTFEPVYANDQEYTIAYASGDEIFDIEGEGTSLKHKGVAAGSETFTITAEDTTNNASCTLTLSVEKELDEPSAVTFTGLDTSYEKDTVIPDLGQYVTVDWEHDDLNHYEHDTYTLSFETGSESIISLAEVEGTWSATCVEAGTTTLTAVVTPDAEGAESVTSDPVTIQVVISATGIVIDGDDTYDLIVDDPDCGSVQLTAAFTPSDATDTEGKTISWRTDNDSVATVSTEGLVTAIGEGTTTITAYYDTFEASVTINVTVPVVPFESLTINFTILGYSGVSLGYREDISVYCAGAFDTVSSGGWVEHTLTSNTDGTYTLVLTTLPENGATYNLYASNDDNEGDDMWNHMLCEGLSFSITGEESGAVVQNLTVQVNTHDSWDTWDDVFPTFSGDVNFYIITWASTGVETIMSNNLKKLYSDYAYFNGSQECDITYGTQNNQSYIYNTIAGTADAEHRDNYFEFYDGTTNWNYEAATGAIEIPNADSGTCYSVYVCVNNATGMTKGTKYNSWGANNQWSNDACKSLLNSDSWATNVTDIAAFITSINPTNSSWIM